MQNRTQYDMQTALAAENELVGESELGILKDVFRMLPSGITVQDEQGRFLLMNDAAAAQLGIGPAGSSRELDQRRQNGIELLRTGRSAVAEECFTTGPVKQVLPPATGRARGTMGTRRRSRSTAPMKSAAS